MRYDCLVYANKQNIERQKTTVQQEPIFITNMVLNNSTTTNVLIRRRFLYSFLGYFLSFFYFKHQMTNVYQ